MKKLIGYLLAGIGLVGLAVSFEKIGNLIPFVEQVPKNYFLIGGLVLVVLGVVVMIGKSGGKHKPGEEIPIYKGKKLVGYRVG